MKITSLELTNFSRHSELKITPQGGVVGILGSNGSGKSSILTALEFALTGQMRDTLESYLKLGTTSGSVTAEFEHQGRKYTIHRTMGKSSRRWLETPDGKLTAAREVDEALNRIFDVDKKTLANAVFVKQGELQHLLFGTYTERRTQLIRLTNLSYLAGRVTRVIAQREKVKSEMVDLAPLKEQMTRDVAVAEESYQLRYEEMMALPDVTESLGRQRTELRNIQQADELTAQMTVARKQRQDLQWSISMEEKEKGTNLAKLETDIASRHAAITNTAPHLQEYYRVLVASGNLKQVHADLESQEQRLKDAETAFNNTIVPYASLEELLKHIQEARAKLQGQAAGKKLSDRILVLQAHRKPLAEQRQGLQLPSMTKEEITQKDNELKAQRDIWVVMHQQWLTMKEITQCFKPGESKCPKCGLEISNTQALTPEALETMRLINEKEKQRLDSCQTTLEYRLSELLRYEQTKLRLEQQLEDLDRQLLVANTEMMGHTLLNYQEEADVLSKLHTQEFQYTSAGLRQSEWNTQKGQLWQLQQSKVRLEELLAQVPNWESFTNEGYHKLQTQAADWQDELRKFQELRVRFQSRQTEVESLNKQLLAYHKRLTAIPATTLTLAEQAALPNELSKLEAVQRARDQASGIFINANSVLNNLRTQWDELLEREKSQQRRQDVVADLDKLITWLSDEGLPQRFLQKQFMQLQSLTQHHLSRLGANFTLTAPDLEQLEMRFFRPGESGASLSMQKLSGGQKIRLGMSFLLAVQQLLVPQLGLLVLDEPSTHLDEDGVEALALMLYQLGGELSAGGISFWLADHHPLLQSGLSDVCLLPD